MAKKGPKWPKLAWITRKWHPKPSPFDFCFSCGHFKWSHDQFTTILSLGPKLAKNSWKGPKWPKMAWTPEKWQMKPSPLKFYFSCGHFQWSYDLSVPILNLRSNLAKNGQNMPRPQVTKNGQNFWKVTSETMSIGLLLLLRSFWVVTWLVRDNFEFQAKIGP